MKIEDISAATLKYMHGRMLDNALVKGPVVSAAEAWARKQRIEAWRIWLAGQKAYWNA